MSTFVFADDGLEFDGRSVYERPLGGVETALCFLSEALAARRHRVFVRNMCKEPIHFNGVDWAPLKDGLPEAADVYVANRGDKLIRLMPQAKRQVFWTHNPCRFMTKWKYLWKLFLVKPTIVFVGDYHATTLPAWVPDSGRVVIPLAPPEICLHETERSRAPAPVAVFTSNPQRGLDWLLDLWAAKIHPACPSAQLHIYSGPEVYKGAPDKLARRMKPVLDKAEGLRDRGVVLRGPQPKDRLMDDLKKARIMLYKGDENETYCFSVAEAQALGLPAVVQDQGSMRERVVDGVTGRVTNDDDAYAQAAIDLLTRDSIWSMQHCAALKTQRDWTWDKAAQAFERLVV